jgi:hypothetical protein
MRIQEILIESHQLDEGPILNKIGSAVGKGVGTLAKGVGAVAGGIAGLGAAAKKGFQAGKSTVSTGGDDADPAATGAPAGGTGAATGAPAGGAGAAVGGASGAAAGQAVGGATATKKPAAGGASGGSSTKPKGFIAGVKAGQAQGLSAFNDPNVVGSSSSGTTPAAGEEDPAAADVTTPPSAADINKAGPAGTAQAKPIQGTAAKQAAAKTGAALAGQDQAQAGQTMYSQVKANVDKLDKKGKQRILQLLQKSLTAPEAKPAAGGAMGAMAGQLAKGGAAQPNTMANAPVSKTNTAKPGNPNAAPAAEPAPVAPAATTTAPAGKKPVRVRGKKAAQPVPQQQMASKINTGSMVLEGFSLFRKK